MSFGLRKNNDITFIFQNPATGGGSGGGGGTNYWTLIGNDISNNNAGEVIINTSKVKIGREAGLVEFGSASDTIAIGNFAGSNSQRSNAIAIGGQAAFNNQGLDSIAIGFAAGGVNQGPLAVSLGSGAGNNNQGSNAIAIGYQAGFQSQRSQAVSIGYQAGRTGQQQNAIAIGFEAGETNQGENCVAIGTLAGTTGQTAFSVAIGFESGATGQNAYSVGLGSVAGAYNQQQRAVAIGFNAGATGQGTNAIAIGAFAGYSQQRSNSICIDASATNASEVLNVINRGLYVRPIRIEDSSNGFQILRYNTSTSEIFHSPDKTFIIDHPVNKDKYLVHACLEGPEAGVYYRGRGTITNNTDQEIILPSYTLSFTDFTIQVTPINSTIKYGVTEVKDGKFKVIGKNGSFFWHVHALRNIINVEPNKSDVEVKGDGPYKYIM